MKIIRFKTFPNTYKRLEIDFGKANIQNVETSNT